MKDFFKGISFSQIIASALAAVTSFFLASKIGVAGSLIGAGVAAFISTAASQIYKNVIDKSTEKIKSTEKTQPGNGQDSQQNESSEEARANQENTDSTGERTSVLPSQSSATGANTQHIEQGAPRTVSSNGAIRTSKTAGESATGKPAKHHQQMTKHDKRIAIVIAVVTALVAVGVTAGIVLAVTDGKGTGPTLVPRPVETSTYAPVDHHGDTKQQPDSQPTGKGTDSKDANNSTPAPDTGSSAGTQGTTQDQQNTENGTGNSGQGTQGPTSNDSGTGDTGNSGTGTGTNDSGSGTTDGGDAGAGTGTGTGTGTQGNQGTGSAQQ